MLWLGGGFCFGVGKWVRGWWCAEPRARVCFDGLGHGKDLFFWFGHRPECSGKGMQLEETQRLPAYYLGCLFVRGRLAYTSCCREFGDAV